MEKVVRTVKVEKTVNDNFENGFVMDLKIMVDFLSMQNLKRMEMLLTAVMQQLI